MYNKKNHLPCTNPLKSINEKTELKKKNYLNKIFLEIVIVCEFDILLSHLKCYLLVCAKGLK